MKKIIIFMFIYFLSSFSFTYGAASSGGSEQNSEKSLYDKAEYLIKRAKKLEDKRKPSLSDKRKKRKTKKLS